MVRLLLLALLLTGCTLSHATDGPVTVLLGPAAQVTAICRGYAGAPRDYRGCLARSWDGAVILVCGHGDVACIAHEIRHAVDPTWRHD